MSLHLSKCHIVGNIVPWLNYSDEELHCFPCSLRTHCIIPGWRTGVKCYYSYVFSKIRVTIKECEMELRGSDVEC